MCGATAAEGRRVDRGIRQSGTIGSTTGGIAAPAIVRDEEVLPLLAVSTRDPIRRAIYAVTFGMGNAVFEGEFVTRPEVPGVLADGEPHFTLNDHRLEGKRMRVGFQDRGGRPLSFQNLVEALGFHVRCKAFEIACGHLDPFCGPDCIIAPGTVKYQNAQSNSQDSSSRRLSS